jgi:hypothetical protein
VGTAQGAGCSSIIVGGGPAGKLILGDSFMRSYFRCAGRACTGSLGLSLHLWAAWHAAICCFSCICSTYSSSAMHLGCMHAQLRGLARRVLPVQCVHLQRAHQRGLDLPWGVQRQCDGAWLHHTVRPLALPLLHLFWLPSLAPQLSMLSTASHARQPGRYLPCRSLSYLRFTLSCRIVPASAGSNPGNIDPFSPSAVAPASAGRIALVAPGQAAPPNTTSAASLKLTAAAPGASPALAAPAVAQAPA